MLGSVQRKYGVVRDLCFLSVVSSRESFYIYSFIPLRGLRVLQCTSRERSEVNLLESLPSF